MKQNITPEALRTFGSPWFVAGLPGSSRVGASSWPLPGMGQFVIQIKGSATLVTFPYHASLEHGATMAGTEEWLMALSLDIFNQFSKMSLQAVLLNENSVVWIPYGWVIMLVNCRDQLVMPQALVIPYLNAKLALRYPSLGLLAKFHIENVKFNQKNRVKHWTDYGGSYLEWLSSLIPQEDSSAVGAGTQVITLASMDMKIGDGDIQAKEVGRDIHLKEGEN